MAVRGFVIFETDHPGRKAEGGALPPGRLLAEAIAAKLRRAGVDLASGVSEHDAYGWCFTVKHSGIAIWCMLQRSDTWLLISEPRRTLLDRLRGRAFESSHRAVCKALDRAARSLDAVRGVRWYTRGEFEAGVAGAEHPE